MAAMTAKTAGTIAMGAISGPVLDAELERITLATDPMVFGLRSTARATTCGNIERSQTP
jgi:hypothetical protein